MQAIRTIQIRQNETDDIFHVDRQTGWKFATLQFAVIENDIELVSGWPVAVCMTGGHSIYVQVYSRSHSLWSIEYNKCRH